MSRDVGIPDYHTVLLIGCTSSGIRSFSLNDLKSVSLLVHRLTLRSLPVDRWLWETLSLEAKAILTSFQEQKTPEKEVARVLVQGLNNVLEADLIDKDGRFDGFPLRDETQILRSSTDRRIHPRRLNRLLIEDAYPVELARSVGYSCDFLLHDPGGMPYLEASVQQMLNASTYTDESADIRDSNAKLTSLNFQPVTPGAVLMPLHVGAVSSGETFAKRPGIYDISVAFHFEESTGKRRFAHCKPSPKEFLSGEFRLAQADGLQDTLCSGTWTTQGLEPLRAGDPLFDSVRKLRDGLGRLCPDRWFWVQRFADSCWVWDAKHSPPEHHDFTPRQCYKYLLAVADRDSQYFLSPGTEIADQVASQPHFTLASKQPNRKRLDISLISSFCADSVAAAAASWPVDVPLVELYAFMQKDVTNLLKPTNLNWNAVQAMHSLAGNTAETRRIAAEVSANFETTNAKVCALATFMPELLFEDDDGSPSQSRKEAVGALQFLCELAFELRSLGKGHAVDVIELVAGSRIDGVMPIRHEGKPCILANLKPKVPNLQPLLDNIQQVYNLLHDRYKPMKFAIEIEPGPLFAFSTSAGLDNLVSQIEIMEGYGFPLDVVGLNVDIGHYMLSQIPPEKLREDSIARRVFNAHISDHPKAHTADCVLGTINDSDVFQRWINELCCLPNTFPGRVSIEMECIKDAAMLGLATKATARVASYRPIVFTRPSKQPTTTK